MNFWKIRVSFGSQCIMYCIEWYGIVLYCIVLYCMVLYCIVLLNESAKAPAPVSMSFLFGYSQQKSSKKLHTSYY
jgi:hypothetical protein